MRFELGITLDNAEVSDLGIDYALPVYLADVIVAVTEGRADAGIVRDGNGGTIGKWRTYDDEIYDSGDDAAQFRVTTPDHVDTDSRPLPDDGDSFAAHAEGYR